jgi:hypothetical protein
VLNNPIKLPESLRIGNLKPPSHCITSAALLFLPLFFFLPLLPLCLIQINSWLFLSIFIVNLLLEILPNLLGERLKQLGNIDIILCTGLDMLDVVFACELLAFLRRDLPFRGRAVGLIPDDDSADVLGVVLVDLLQPVLNVVERLPVCERVHLRVTAICTRMMPAAPL